MKRIKILLKYFLGNSFNNASNGIKSKNLAILFYVLILFGLSIPIADMIDNMYEPFSKIGQEGYLLSIIFLLGSLVVLVLGIYDILDSFFFSQDIEPLMPLPFKSSEIMIGKFITCLIDMYIYLAIIILPLITFGINNGEGITYFLMMILVYLFSPIVVVVFCILITMILMSFINISKYQNVFKIVFGTLGIIIMLGIYSLNSMGINQESISLAMQQNDGLINLTNKLFITNIFSAKALLYSNSLEGLINLVILIVISILALTIAYSLGKMLYNKILNNRLNVYSERKNILQKEGNKVIVRNSKIKTLIIREFRTILRDPSNFINCVVMLLYMPVFIFIFFLKGHPLAGDSQNKIDIIIMSATFLVTSLTITGNSVAATALSREGKDIFVSKYIPVDYKIQIHAKIITSFMINGLVLILGLVIVIYLKASPLVIILSLLIQLGTLIAISLVGILLDYSSPKLSWVDTKNLYSKNFKPLLIMLVCLIFGALNFSLMLTNSVILIFLIDIILLIIVSGVLYKLLIKTALETYKKDLI